MKLHIGPFVLELRRRDAPRVPITVEHVRQASAVAKYRQRQHHMLDCDEARAWRDECDRHAKSAAGF